MSLTDGYLSQCFSKQSGPHCNVREGVGIARKIGGAKGSRSAPTGNPPLGDFRGNIKVLGPISAGFRLGADLHTGNARESTAGNRDKKPRLATGPSRNDDGGASAAAENWWSWSQDRLGASAAA